VEGGLRDLQQRSGAPSLIQRLSGSNTRMGVALLLGNQVQNRTPLLLEFRVGLPPVEAPQTVGPARTAVHWTASGTFVSSGDRRVKPKAAGTSLGCSAEAVCGGRYRRR